MKYEVFAKRIDSITVLLFTFHDGHLGKSGANRFAKDIRKALGNTYDVYIVTSPA